MNFKNIIAITFTAGGLFLSATSAQAFTTYLTDVNTAYGSSYTNCLVCHGTTGNFPTDKGVTAYANQYRVLHNAALIAALDADNDGFTNGQEGVLSTDLNSALSSPFTVAVTNATIADTVLTNFVVKGDAAATAQLFTDPYSLATAGSTQIIGNESLTINIAPVDIYYKTSGVDNTMTLYMVDPYGQGTVSPQGSGWTANADGSLRIVALPAGITQVTGVMVRAIPVVTPVGGGTTTFPISGDNDGEGDDENNTVGCMTSSLSTPLLMTFMLLGLGFFARRKKG